MIHVWLDKPKDKYKVWNNASLSWSLIDSFSELNSASFIKCNDKEVCLYLPTQNILTLANELSTAQLKQLGQSGQQYLFEELSLTPVEQLRVRQLSNNHKRYFYALGVAEIEQWEQSLTLAGYTLTALLPDFVLLPSPDKLLNSEVVLYQQRDDLNNSAQSSILLRFSESEGTAVSHISLLPRLLSNVEEIIYVSDSTGYSENNSEITVPDYLKQIGDEAGIVITPSNQTLTPVATPLKHPLNFIEVIRSRLASPYLTLAAGIFLLAGITQIAADAIQWYQYNQATIATKAAIDEQFSSWFSGESLNPRVDLVSQVEPRLMADNKQQPQIQVMSRIAPLIRQSQLTAESLRWNDANIIITVKGENRSGIDKLQQGLNDQGLSANLGTVSPTEAGSVIGEINIALNTQAQYKTSNPVLE